MWRVDLPNTQNLPLIGQEYNYKGFLGGLVTDVDNSLSVFFRALYLNLNNAEFGLLYAPVSLSGTVAPSTGAWQVERGIYL